MSNAYVALLRGVNLAGHRRVPMGELRDACTALGFRDVASYLQSGNVVFRAAGESAVVAAKLEAALAQRFGFAVPVILRDRGEMERIAARHPFDDRQDDPARLHVFFLGGDPEPARVAALRPERWAPDELVIDGREVYVHFPNGMGRSKVSINLGPPATARNWRTVQALRDLVVALED